MDTAPVQLLAPSTDVDPPAPWPARPFGRSGETSQQLARGRLRAVEHGRAVLVAATSGVSAVISPDGSLVESAPVFTREVLSASVPTRTGTTLATRVGAAPELLLSGLALAASGVAVRRRARR